MPPPKAFVHPMMNSVTVRPSIVCSHAQNVQMYGQNIDRQNSSLCHRGLRCLLPWGNKHSSLDPRKYMPKTKILKHVHTLPCGSGTIPRAGMAVFETLCTGSELSSRMKATNDAPHCCAPVKGEQEQQIRAQHTNLKQCANTGCRETTSNEATHDLTSRIVAQELNEDEGPWMPHTM